MDNTKRRRILRHALRRCVEAYGLHALFTLVSTLYRSLGGRGTTPRSIQSFISTILGNSGNLRFAAAVGLYSGTFGLLRHELLTLMSLLTPSHSSSGARTSENSRQRTANTDERQSQDSNDTGEMSLKEPRWWIPTETLPALAAALAVIAIYTRGTTGSLSNSRARKRDNQFELNPLRLSLDLVVRAAASYCLFFVRGTGQRRLERWMCDYIPSACFILGCHEVMYDWFYHPQVLPKLYRQWISSLARIDERLLKVLRGFKDGSRAYGTHSNDLDEFCRQRGVPPAWGDPGTGFIPCSVVHSEFGSSCINNAVHRWLNGFFSAMRLYFPLQSAAALLSNGFSGESRRIIDILKTCALSSARSSTFLASFIVTIWWSICTLRNLTQNDSSWGVVLGSFLCGFSILLEKSSRRSELALYVVPRGLVSLLRRKSIQNFVLGVRGRCILSAIASILFAKVYLGEQNGKEPRRSTLSSTARVALKWLVPSAAF